MPDDLAAARERIGIPAGNRLILCLDGGGIRGIFTLQLLKRLEEVAGRPCHELIDMVAGTSTGGIIAGFLAAGHTAAEVEQLYCELVEQVFQTRAWYASQMGNPPLYTKRLYVARLKELLGDATLAEVAQRTATDLLITAKDVKAGEETYFSYLAGRGDRANTYGAVLLRAVLEATMSAPTYFHPLERFIDGGVTSHNNPTLAAIIEAVHYGPAGAYDPAKLTVLSLGTACRPQFTTLEGIANPKGMDIFFWLKWLLTEASDDAADMQCYLLRSSRLMAGIDFRRFQVSLDNQAIARLPPRSLADCPDTKAASLAGLTDEELGGIALDNVAYFPVMKEIGLAVADAIVAEADRRGVAPFSFDLCDDRRRDLFVTRQGDRERILAQLSDPAWLDAEDRPV